MSYIRSLSNDFSGNLNPDQLQGEINGNAGIAPECLGVINPSDVVEIHFDAPLSAAEETTLATIISAHTPIVPVGGSLANFDALVAADGSGDYLKPSEAFAAGATSVYIRSGTYIETADVVMPNYGVLAGESVAPAVIYFAGPVGVKVDGSSGVKETTGTISLAHGTSVVTGTGTTFTNVPLNARTFIMLNENFYQVGAIVDDTTLALVDPYQGATLSNAKFMLQHMYTGVTVNNCILYNSATTGLYMRAVRSAVINVIGCMNCNVGMHLVDSAANIFTTLNAFNNTTHGMRVENTHSVGFVSGEMYNNGEHGVLVDGESGNVVFNGVLVSNNGADGVCVKDNATYVMFNTCVVQNNHEHGVETLAGTGNCIVDGTMLLCNGGDGLNLNGENNVLSNCAVAHNRGNGVLTTSPTVISGSHLHDNVGCGCHLTDESQVTGNNIHGNGMDGIYATHSVIQGNCLKHNVGCGIQVNNGAQSCITGNSLSSNTLQGIKLVGNARETTLTGNQITGGTVGIEIPAGSDDCVVNGNIVQGNSSHGLSLGANECIVSGNRVRNNGGDGCVILAGASDNTVKINRFTGNTGGDFTDNGTATIKD